MAFYVKLGARGLIFRLGTLAIGIIGRAIYWKASRKRAAVPHPFPTCRSITDA